MTADSKQDLIGLQKIGRIVALTLQQMKKQVCPGITTAGLDKIGEAFLKKHGARSAPQLVHTGVFGDPDV